MTKIEHILNNLDKMIAISSSNPFAKRLWEIKKQEYLRQLRWEIMDLRFNYPDVVNNRGYIGDEFETEAD